MARPEAGEALGDARNRAAVDVGEGDTQVVVLRRPEVAAGQRQDPAPDRVADHEVRNHGTVAEGGEALLRAIRAARASALAGSAPAGSTPTASAPAGSAPTASAPAASPLPHPIDPAPRGRTETP